MANHMAKRSLAFLAQAHPTLGRKVFELAGIPVGRVSWGKFSDGETHCVVESDVKGLPVFVFQTGAMPMQESLWDLILLCDALKHAGARRVVVILPFVPYRRQEKQTRPGESLTLRLVGELLQTAGVDEVITVNLHRPKTVTWLARQVYHLSVLDDMIRAVGKFHTIDVVCAPDNGAIPLAQTAAQELGASVMSVMKKRVGPNKVSFTPFHSGINEQVRGKRILIVDDEIDTGATILGVARMLKAAGATSVTVAAVHGVLSGKAEVNLKQVGYDRLFLTDTLPLKTSKWPRLKLVSVAPVLAEAVARRAQWL